MKRAFLFLAAFAIVLAIGSCKQASFYGALGDKIATPPLTIAPRSASLFLGSTITLSATGGVQPYAFSIVSGVGTLNNLNGLFTATATGNVVIRVTDRIKGTSDSSIAVTPTGLLTINPVTASVGLNSSIQFVAAGGTPPYSFSLGATTSSPTINGASGLYTSGFTSGGADQVRVTDSAASTAAATVDVTATVTNVDYTIQSGIYPTAGTGGRPIPGGYSFTVRNGGVAAGGRPVNWWVYLSNTVTLNTAGTILLSSGSTPALGAGASTAVPITGTWPVVPVPAGATRYLFVMIQADDDLNSSNNLTTANAVVLNPPNVDYSVSAPSSTGGLVAGQAVTGNFTLQNLGSDAGVLSVAWTAYVSTDSTATIDAGAKAIDSGSAAALGASPASTVVSFAGVWPTAPGGPYYLKASASSPEDINTANNVSVSGPYTTTFVDYTVTAVNNLGGTGAGQTLSASFDLKNIGTGAGSQPVSWTAYVSPTATLGAGDAVLASGTVPASGVPATVPFSALWPTTAGTWYLIISISAADDTVPSNNTVASAAFVTTPAQPDYTVISVTNTGSAPWIPGAPVPFTFQIKNISTQNGTQPLSWTVYASTKNFLDGSAIPVASGTNLPFAAGATVPISSSGPWPLNYGNYYLIASVTVAEDVNPSNNSAPTAGTTPVGIYSETEPNGDYVGLTNYNNFGIAGGVVMRPGMSILINASLPNPVNNTDKDDIFQFNTGTANAINFSMSWTGSFDAGLFPMTGPNTFPPGSAIGITAASSLALGWVPDAPSVPRWIDVQDGVGGTYGKENIGPYTLVISAN